jgi:hypothetical protein
MVPATYVEGVYLGLTISHLALLPTGVEVAARRISGAEDNNTFAPDQTVAVAWRTEDARLLTS